VATVEGEGAERLVEMGETAEKVEKLKSIIPVLSCTAQPWWQEVAAVCPEWVVQAAWGGPADWGLAAYTDQA
jgi:hypothetical protein